MAGGFGLPGEVPLAGQIEDGLPAAVEQQHGGEAIVVTATIRNSAAGVRGHVARPMPSAGNEAIRGRDAEQRTVRGLLRQTQRGLGGVLLVEGELGIGKSLLLRESEREAAGHGFSLAAGAADQLS